MKIIRVALLAAATPVLFACQSSDKAQQSSKPQSSGSSSSITTSQSSDEPSDGTVVAQWKQNGESKSITYGELKELRQAAFVRLRLERYERLKAEIENYIGEEVMKAEAKKEGKTLEQFREGIQASISDEELKKFYDARVAPRPGSPAFDAVKEQIRRHLAQGKFQEFKQKSELKVTLPQPSVSFDLAGRPSKGPEDAKITIVEFSDFQCPYCARATKPVEDIVKAFPKEVRVFFMHFPLIRIHPQAMPAAIATRCAQHQGKFWEMHDKVFSNQRKLSDEDLAGYAESLGLDADKYKKCVADPATEAYVQEDLQQGNNAGVSGTPSFYINGRKHQGGPPSVEQIRTLLKS